MRFSSIGLQLCAMLEVRSQIAACDRSHVKAGQELDHSILFQRKINLVSVVQGATDESSADSQITAADMNAGLVTNTSKLDLHTNRSGWTDHPDPLLAVANGLLELLAHPDVTMGLVLMLFIIVPCCCCCCYVYAFLDDFRWPFLMGNAFDLYDKRFQCQGGMQPGMWMVLTEFGVQQVRFFAFEDQDKAQKFFNSCAPYIARVIFMPMPWGNHAEVRAAGMNRFTRDYIRTWSHRPVNELVPNKYNVVVYKKRALFFVFDDEKEARLFMDRFEWVASVLYDPTGVEIAAKGRERLCGVFRIRQAVASKHMTSSDQLEYESPVPTRGMSMSSLDSGMSAPQINWETKQEADPLTPGCGGTMI